MLTYSPIGTKTGAFHFLLSENSLNQTVLCLTLSLPPLFLLGLSYTLHPFLLHLFLHSQLPLRLFSNIVAGVSVTLDGGWIGYCIN
jgi:hypothetical protein